jgi:type IV pilus assembly protein PilA
LRIQERIVGQWFYAEGNRQQRGPLASEELIALYTSSRIGLDTLVWRDGLSQWQPLRSVADEIGLVIVPVTPVGATPSILDEPIVETPAPVPPRIPATFEVDTRTRTAPPPRQPAFTQPVAAPPKKSGCGPVAIVLIVVAVVGVAALGILAAIALPAYNDYVTRAKLAQVTGELAPLKGQVVEFVDIHDRGPVNGDDGFSSPGAYATDGVGQVRIGRFGEGRCGIEIELSQPGKPTLDGKMLWWEYDTTEQQWSCSSDADSRKLPPDCRG